MHGEQGITIQMGDKMRRKLTRIGHNHGRVRLCTGCHGWFVLEGAHRCLCTLCRAEAIRIPAISGEMSTMDATTRYDTAVRAGQHVDV